MIVTDGKLFIQLLRAMNHVDGSNNYAVNRLDVEVKTNGIIIESVCVNDYGTGYSNNDKQFIPKDELPNFAVRKLYCCK